MSGERISYNAQGKQTISGILEFPVGVSAGKAFGPELRGRELPS